MCLYEPFGNIRMANVCLTHFVLRMVCNKESVSRVNKARHVARREEGGLLGN